MKFSSQEEYGLRCLLQLGRAPFGASMTIQEISRAEKLSGPHVAKLMRILRQAGFVESVRGQSGGYVLARPASEIALAEVLDALGGKLYEDDFCEKFSGSAPLCTHNSACAIRSLWQKIQQAVDGALVKTTLRDLLGDPHSVSAALS